MVGHRTISNTLELDTAQDVEKKTIENRTVGKMLALLKNAVRTLLEKCRFTHQNPQGYYEQTADGLGHAWFSRCPSFSWLDCGQSSEYPAT